MKSQEAKDTIVYVIENGEVKTTNLYDHVMASATEVTSPRGIWNKMFVEEVEDATYMGEVVEGKKWALREWQANGRAKIVDLFDTEEEADNECFRLHKAYDFAKDDQRDTQYWHSKEEAEKELIDQKKYL